MGGLVFLVPVLLVVSLGYAVAYVAAEAVGVAAPEAVAWPAGLLLFAVTAWVLVRYRRRRRRARGLPAGARRGRGE